MKNEIRIETQINAPANTVWSILTDFSRYPDWNPLIPSIDANLSVGSPVSFTLRAHGLDLPVIGAEITNVARGEDFRWAGPANEMLAQAVRLEHYFTVQALGPDSCRFIHGEFATGLLADLVFQLLQTAEGGYKDMNLALKNRAEAEYRKNKQSA